MTKKKKKSVKKDRQEKRLQCLSEKEQQKIDDIAECLAETEYQIKCQCAIDILIAKLQMINTELSKQKGRTVVNQISSRKKSAESIYAKLVRKGYKTDFQTAAEKLNDLVGVRVVCPFEYEVYEVANILKAQGDVEVLKEKDYIKVPKKNGYKSLHITLEIPIYFAKGSQKQKVEVQFRTVAMDYWSVLDYQLFYKKQLDGSDEVAAELKKYAEDIAKLDARMLKLRDKIEKI